MKLSAWAQGEGIHYQTAWRWWRRGTLPVPARQTQTGMIPWSDGTGLPRRWIEAKTCSGCGAAKAKLPLSERIFRCDACGLVIDRDENAALNLAALASVVAASGAETENARPLTQVSPGSTGRRVDREAGAARAASETGAASRQREAA